MKTHRVTLSTSSAASTASSTETQQSDLSDRELAHCSADTANNRSYQAKILFSFLHSVTHIVTK